MPVYVNYEGLQAASADVNTVKAKFNEEMAELRNIVGGTTQNDWKGPDANLFVSNTKAKLDKLEQEYDEFMKALIDSINENHDAFKSTQQHNINSQGD